MRYLISALVFVIFISVYSSETVKAERNVRSLEYENFSPAPSAFDVLLRQCAITAETNIQNVSGKSSEKLGRKDEAPKIDVNPFKRRNFMGLKTFLFRYFIMPIKRTLAFLFEEVDHDTHFVMKKGIKDNEKSEKTYKCLPTNHSSVTVNFIPEGDLVIQMNETSARCGFVLFYTPYCRFSMDMMPSYKALARIFPPLNLFAVKINSYSSSCIQFGAVGTPTVMFYHNSRPVRKMPPLMRNISSMAEYVANITDLEAASKVEVVEADLEGVELLSSFDWVLCFSVLFIAGSACYNLLNTEVGQTFLAKFITRTTD